MDQAALNKLSFIPLGTFHERKGITVIATRQQADANGLRFDMSWACITLEVRLSLSAVGFLTAVTASLALAGISVNPVSAFYHDHLFVPYGKKEQALEVLMALSPSG